MTPWDHLAVGANCSFDAPRPDSSEHWDAIAKLQASTLYLPKNQTYRGHCVLVFDLRHAIRLDQLGSREWLEFADDLHRTVTAVAAVCAPDHMNVESLGNVMPHLHWHVIPRYKTDPRWGAPIWPSDLREQIDRRLLDDDRAVLLLELRNALR
jgi:diadenosine tetraphosphate (Ap4A) HIT family hydrolase